MYEILHCDQMNRHDNANHCSYNECCQNRISHAFDSLTTYDVYTSICLD